MSTKWIYGDDGILHGTPGVPDVNPSTGVISVDEMLRVEPGWAKFRWLDARHLKGAGGQAGTSFAWSHTSQGPQSEPGRRLVGLSSAGWNDVWCDVTDPVGTRRYTGRTFYISHDYEVHNGPPNADRLADGGWTPVEFRPYLVQDPTGPVGAGLAMHIEVRPIIVPGIASPPQMQNGDPIGGQTTRYFDAPAGVAGAKQYFSWKYQRPTDVPPNGLVWGWEPVITFPTRPEIPEVRWFTIWHRFVPTGTLAPGTTLACRTPFPAGHITRPDLTKLPLAASGDFAGAATQDAMSDRFAALLAAKPFLLDGSDASGTPIYVVTDMELVPKKDFGWHNSQNVSGGTGVGNGQQTVLNVPVPTGAVASTGTDRNYNVFAPNYLGGTDTSSWQTSQRYGNTEPYGRPRAGGVTADTPQHGWWSTSGGTTNNLAASVSGQLSANHWSSVSGISIWGMIVTVDEMQAAVTAYHPTNQAAWDTIVDHVIYMLSTQYKSGATSWPAKAGDGQSADVRDLASGQIVSIHPDFDLTALNWTGKTIDHILARAMQRRGAIQADTCGGGYQNLGCQSGITYTIANGSTPWTTMRNSVPNGPALTNIPATFVHPTTSVVTKTWRVHKRLANQAEWVALNA